MTQRPERDGQESPARRLSWQTAATVVVAIAALAAAVWLLYWSVGAYGFGVTS